MEKSRTPDGRFELRSDEGLNPYVEMYGDSDESQTDFTWTLVLVETNEVVAEWSGWIDHNDHRSGVATVVLGDDGESVLVDGERMAIASLVEQARVAREQQIRGLALTADGASLVVSNDAEQLVIVDANTLAVVRRMAAPPSAGVLACSPDGSAIAVACAGSVALVEPESRWTTPLAGTVYELRFDPTATTIAARLSSDRLVLLRASDGAVIRELPQRDQGFGFTAKGDRLVLRNDTGIVSVRIADGSVRKLAPQPRGDARLYACVPARERLFLRDWDHGALTKLNGKPVARFEGQCSAVYVDEPRGSLIAAFRGQYNGGQLYGESDHLKRIDLESGRELRRVELIVGEPVAVAGDRLFSRSYDRSLVRHHLSTGDCSAVMLARSRSMPAS
jgi:NADH:ubiquinone oxidoreductase subunit